MDKHTHNQPNNQTEIDKQSYRQAAKYTGNKRWVHTHTDYQFIPIVKDYS